MSGRKRDISQTGVDIRRLLGYGMGFPVGFWIGIGKCVLSGLGLTPSVPAFDYDPIRRFRMGSDGHVGLF